jgi:pimeloyl-ACP methyl ester carboxylesterase
MIPPATERWFAERMKPRKTIELAAGHASMASRPGEIIALIEEAARTWV